MTGYFMTASSIESLAALLFNGFIALFLLPILLMDLCFYFPAALVHLAAGKARPRIVGSALGGFLLWTLCVGAGLAAVYLIQPRAFALLFRTYSGLAGLLIGALSTLAAFVRYRRSMRAYYFAQVLEKNLSAKQAAVYERFKADLKSGKVDAARWMDEHGRDHIGRRIAQEYLDGLEGRSAAQRKRREGNDLYFL